MRRRSTCCTISLQLDFSGSFSFVSKKIAYINKKKEHDDVIKTWRRLVFANNDHPNGLYL